MCVCRNFREQAVVEKHRLVQISFRQALHEYILVGMFVYAHWIGCVYEL